MIDLVLGDCLEVAQPSDYLEFLQKFKAKKTTDDCYTPVAVYQAVLEWTVREYSLQGRRVVRPFIPNGDYQAFEYQAGDVVIDNPPFSIFTAIQRFYIERGVDFMLFGPALTLLSGNPPTGIIVDATVEYANGAKVPTSFATNLDRVNRIRTAPELKAAIEMATASGKVTATLPKYKYPGNVVTAALLGKISTVDFSVPFNHCSARMSRLDSQVEAKKGLFGGGYLISDEKAAELKAAELKAAELKAAKEVIVWGLSESERKIINGLK